MTLSLEKLALLIMRRGDVNPIYSAGSILASDNRAWRYQNDELIEVAWSDYERALNSDDRDDWPPYTISFTITSLSDDEAVVSVATDYDQGICEESRGGCESTWRLKYEDGGWRIQDIEYKMSWD